MFFSFLLFSAISAKEGVIDFVDEITYSIKNVIVSLLTTHFVLRAYIKKHLQNSSSSLKVYSIAILLSAALATVANVIWGVAFGKADKAYFSFDFILMNISVYLFLYIIWSALYLAITSIRERIILRQQLRDQELASLMNQINPHFLFNSLNTIRGMIYEDKDKSAELVTKLSTLFRYNLSTDTKAHTSLGAELEICQHYLAIEDIRLGDRLKVNFCVSPESLMAKIPTMGLLTLIENAIKHGIAHLQKGGTVTLNSKIENNKLLIEVNNPFQADLVKSGTKVGLNNLKQRIALIFGTQGQLSQQSTGNIFSVSLSLPFEIN
ncbi:MAG: histidine kinase [Colwellia sp.]|jgi:LytS/YehU family sensor histidine kinase|uniref:sensor histidine kinase n=1 Tax=Colwellia sp. Bg11-12 TaxID=2759817 RepID=UPI0015F5E4A8|nr:histidine kinase [Colwellia sp. Bg11-12]MBA6263820.1 histidine kinase [Colwellia sp. Bg11-12]